MRARSARPLSGRDSRYRPPPPGQRTPSLTPPCRRETALSRQRSSWRERRSKPRRTLTCQRPHGHESTLVTQKQILGDRKELPACCTEAQGAVTGKEQLHVQFSLEQVGSGREAKAGPRPLPERLRTQIRTWLPPRSTGPPSIPSCLTSMDSVPIKHLTAEIPERKLSRTSA